MTEQGIIVLPDTLKKVTEFWKQECVNLAKPLLEAEIIKGFAKLDILLSDDVIEVYSNINGFSENDMDSECLSFWTIEKIWGENQLNSEYVYFADFLIDSHFYAFKYENSDVSSIHVHYSENDSYKISDSFDEFFELYLKDPAKLFV